MTEMTSERVAALESELRYSQENLQATVEEMETTNEELQATNEELVASNEELQSTNEELHSVNEELVHGQCREPASSRRDRSVERGHGQPAGDNAELASSFWIDELYIRRFTPEIARECFT